MAIAIIQDGIQIEFQSISGDTYNMLYDTNDSGDLLEAIIEVSKFGGVEKFVFDIPRDKHIVISNNTRIFFYVNGVLWFNGFIKDAPAEDQIEPIRQIEGMGFVNRLKNKVVNKSYIGAGLSEVILDMGTSFLGNELDVYHNPAKIDVPNPPKFNIEFKDKTLYDVYELLLSIANYNYMYNKYIFYVDIDNEVVFEKLSSSLENHFFENFQYQNPDVSEDASGIINKILIYRTVYGTPKTVEYVATYQDITSQSKFGLFEKKITYSDHIPNYVINSICYYILERYKQPQKSINIKSFIVDAPLVFGEYRLSNKRERYWKIASEMDSISTTEGWDFSNMSITTVELSDTRILTGRKSVKFTTADGSLGEYAEFTLPERIPFPIEINIFTYFVSLTVAVIFRLYDKNNNYEEIPVNVLVETMTVDTTSGVQDLQVDTISGVENLDVEFLIASTYDSWSRLFHTISTITDLSKIRIIFNTNTSAVFYIDLIEALADVFSSADLNLESATYKLSSLGLFADCSFGGKQKTIVDEILKEDKKALTSLQIVSKQ